MVMKSNIKVLIDTDLFYRGQYDAAKQGQSGYLNSYERAYNDFLTKFAYDVMKAGFDLSFMTSTASEKDDLLNELEDNYCFTLAHSKEQGPVEFIFNSIVASSSIKNLHKVGKLFFVTDKFLPQEDDQRVFKNSRKNGKLKTLPFNEIVKDKLLKSDSLPAFSGYDFIQAPDVSEILEFKNLNCAFINPLLPILSNTEGFIQFLSEHKTTDTNENEKDDSPFGKDLTFNVVKEYDTSPDFSEDDDDDDTSGDTPLFPKDNDGNVIINNNNNDDSDDNDDIGNNEPDRMYKFLNLDEIKIHYPEEDADPWEKLDHLIGMKNIKEQLLQIKRRMAFDLKRREKGFKEEEKPSNHLVFYGNPGTGKNEVSRILGSLMKNMGVLSKGHVIEVDRSDLVMGYIGQSAIKTKEVLAEAKGGILFIDEAYSLWHGSYWDFGPEVIATLMKQMEDQREDLVIVFAGYKEEMEVLLKSNPGFSSRIRHHLEFIDYSAEELMDIYKKFCGDNAYQIHEDAAIPLKTLMSEAKKMHDMKFGNGRFVRNAYEKTIEKLATRVINMNLETDEDLQLIRPTDIPNIKEVTGFKK